MKLFCSYSHKDEALRDELAKHLKLFERQGLIQSWHDRKIGAGDLWQEAIDRGLREADVILLLISADFLASDYCFDFEMNKALDRHAAGEALVIPVILRPVDWRGTPFSKFQALPADGRPVTTFENLDIALEQVAQGIRRAIEGLREKRQAPARPAAQEPARRAAQEPAQQAAQEPARRAAQEPAQRAAQEPAQRAAQENDTPPQGAARFPPLPAARLDQIAKLLALYIGPIASVVVRQAASRCPGVTELCDAVAHEIANPQDRSRFLSEARRVNSSTVAS
jgi:TIR domain